MPTYTISIKSEDQVVLEKAAQARRTTLKELLKEQMNKCVENVRPGL